MLKKFTLTFVIVLALITIVPADRLLLHNGDKISGTIIKSDREILNLKTEFLGKVQIEWKGISALTAEQILHITVSGGQVLVGPVTTSQNRIHVMTSESGSISVPWFTIESIRSLEEQVIYEAELDRLKNPPLLDFWSGHLDTGMSLAQGNAESTNFATSAKTQRKTDKNKISFYATSLFASDRTAEESRTTANAIRGGTRYDVNMGQRLFTFGFVDLEFDEFQDLDLRNVLGGGLGWKLKDREKNSFEILLGASLNQEFFKGDITRRTGEILIGEEWSYRLIGSMSLSEKLIFYPNFSDLGAFRIQFDTTLAMEMARGFAWHLTLSDRFLNHPLPSLEKNDILFTTGVRFSFGQGL